MGTLGKCFMAAFAIHSVLIPLQLWHVESFTSFIFGDSLVDVGNNDFLFTLSKADSPPYGIDFVPSGGKPTGRFTNGRTVNDIIEEALGATSFSPAYLAPSTDSAILRGLNYASGSSGILDETGNLFIGRIPLSKQVSNFEQTKSHMVNVMGHQKANEVISRAIFSVTTGSNDILNYLQQKSWTSSGDFGVSQSTFQNLLVSNMTLQLKRLQKHGARKILIVGVGPLGCIPIVRALNFVPLGKCSDDVNDLVQTYNLKLRRVLDNLNQKTSYSRPAFIFANPYNIVTKLVQHPLQYGFENAYDPCCGGYFPPFTCLGAANATLVFCKNRSSYVFWDAYHPTESANVIIARELLDGNSSVVSPMNVRRLFKQ